MRIKLFFARIIYSFFRILLKKDVFIIKRKGISYSINLSEGIDLALFLFGRFQPYISNSRYYTLPEDAVVFDIGANIGAMTLKFAQDVPKGHIYAFEAIPSVYTRLVQNISLNPVLSGRITPVNMLVSDSTGEIDIPQTMCASWNVCGQNQNRHPVHGGIRQSVQIEDAVSIDDFCRKNTIQRVDLIKIDTDGTELSVLKGALRTISKNTPVIIFEVSLSVLHEEHLLFDAYDAFFSLLDYRLINLKTGRMITMDNFYREIPFSYTTDVLAIPRRKDFN
ncbi:MAG: FkbM family methyltransferase [Thermodesulfobacteriota bacterium]|nr:FkbM family methyltransferase [Thermodesulfobacteriota bacterium]